MREKPAECDMFPSLMRPPCCPQLESNWVPLLSSDLRIISPALRTHCKHQCILPAKGWVFFPLLFSPYTATSIHVSTGGSRTIPLTPRVTLALWRVFLCLQRPWVFPALCFLRALSDHSEVFSLGLQPNST